MHGNFIVKAPPDFGLYSNPSTLMIRQGSSNTSTVIVNETGSSSGNVSFSASVQPSGPTLHLSALMVNFLSTIRTITVVLNVTVPLGTTDNGYTVTVTGNNGTLSRSTTITVITWSGQTPISNPPPPFPQSLRSWSRRQRWWLEYRSISTAVKDPALNSVV